MNHWTVKAHGVLEFATPTPPLKSAARLSAEEAVRKLFGLYQEWNEKYNPGSHGHYGGCKFRPRQGLLI